jgi:hypothetical protein
MDLRSLKSSGPNLTTSQQNAFYHARKRRRERENAGAAQFKAKGVGVAVKMTVKLTLQ